MLCEYEFLKFFVHRFLTVKSLPFFFLSKHIEYLLHKERLLLIKHVLAATHFFVLWDIQPQISPKYKLFYTENWKDLFQP